jgi:hypothetical protein
LVSRETWARTPRAFAAKGRLGVKYSRGFPVVLACDHSNLTCIGLTKPPWLVLRQMQSKPHKRRGLVTICPFSVFSRKCS